MNPHWHQETEVEGVFRGWLLKRKWVVFDREEKHGPDIEAFDPKMGKWFFEVKGYPNSLKHPDQQRKMRFLYAIGETVCRMKHPDIYRYALVFPDLDSSHYYRKQSLQIGSVVRERLGLWIFLIDCSGLVKVLTPSNDRFSRWSDKFLPKPHARTVSEYRFQRSMERALNEKGLASHRP